MSEEVFRSAYSWAANFPGSPSSSDENRRIEMDAPEHEPAVRAGINAGSMRRLMGRDAPSPKEAWAAYAAKLS